MDEDTKVAKNLESLFEETEALLDDEYDLSFTMANGGRTMNGYGDANDSIFQTPKSNRVLSYSDEDVQIFDNNDIEGNVLYDER